MRQTLLISAIAMTLASAMPPTDAAPPRDPLSTAASLTQISAGGEIITQERARIDGVSGYALALGREVAKDLLEGQQAAARRDSIDTRLALNDARRVLDDFDEPAATRALRQQTAIVRQDLAKEGTTFQPGLWLPLEAELDDALVAAPAEHRAEAHKAIAEGRAAAARGDRDTATGQLAVLEDVLDYRWGLLPLRAVRGDLHAAQIALGAAGEPYWQGVDEALKSALAAIRWITVAHADGWLSAYDKAVNARFLLSIDPQRASAALERVAENLDGLPGATELAAQAHELVARQHPDVKSVDALVASLRAGLPGAGR